ncbi:MAG: methylenetetrahydrofolate reductase [Bacteroidales bacterium]|nr:methylenetetrahydrofolate reductase [Bacteroidales bacterium]
MKVTEIIEQRKGKPFPSLEFVPPLKGRDLNQLYTALEPLMEFRPPFMNLTCHRDERADGRVVSKRPGTVAIAAAVMKRFPVEVIPHLLCAFATADELENELLDLSFLDIENVMALRGDTSGDGPFKAEKGGYRHCTQLVAQIARMNRGIYLEEEIRDAVPTNFCVGVAGYPEKHREAPDFDADIIHLKEKVDAGADYIITQMFYDNAKFYAFVERCRAAGITVPIIPGLKPLSMSKHLHSLPESFALSLPEDLVKAVKACRDESEVYEVGKEWCIAQSRDLIVHGVPAIHYYTMGRTVNIREILSKVF